MLRLKSRLLRKLRLKMLRPKKSLLRLPKPKMPRSKMPRLKKSLLRVSQPLRRLRPRISQPRLLPRSKRLSQQRPLPLTPSLPSESHSIEPEL